MKKMLAPGLVIIGVGLFVIGVSDYVPAGGDLMPGWSESCRYVMTIGAMLAAAGVELRRL